jgi:exportin-1
VNKIIQLSSTEESLRRENFVLRKLDQTLVQIVGQEWPNKWATFIPEIVGSSHTNEALCENNMHILKLLSEEVFDMGGKMTAAKARDLKARFHQDFAGVFQLCEEVLLKCGKPELLTVTLETLLRFLDWIPLGYIFSTQLIDTLVGKFLPAGPFQNLTLQCLEDIVGITVQGTYDASFAKLLVGFSTQLVAILPPTTNLQAVCRDGSETARDFLHHLALLISNLVQHHMAVGEAAGETRAAYQTLLLYLVQLTLLPDREIFKICLDCWNHLTSVLYQAEFGFGGLMLGGPDGNGGGGGSSPRGDLGGCGGGVGGGAGGAGGGPLSLGGPAGRMAVQGQAQMRRAIYKQVFSEARKALIQVMPQPEEILIKEEDGNIVRVTMHDTETTTLYHSMRTTLVYLTHLDPDEMEQVMLDKLNRQMDGSEWSWKNLNTLCWAIGSISGAFTEESEKRFLVAVVKNLLTLTEQKRGKDNKAVVASNIMYIVGQYPRFLRAHWRFLRTVVFKLFEFMHEPHPGVQDMAVDTFLKICDKCRRKFVQTQVMDSAPFIEDMLAGLASTLADLDQAQVHQFFEAVGFILRAVTDASLRDQYLAKLMELPNATWKEIMSNASQNLATLAEPETCKSLVNILKTNLRVATSLEGGFTNQLASIYMELINIYKAYSALVAQAVAAQGPRVVEHFNVRSMLLVKRTILRLITTCVEKTEPASSDAALMATQFIPLLLDPVLSDYATCPPNAREPEVLALFSTVVTTLKGAVASIVPRVLGSVFGCTLEMITKDFVNFPDHRIQFFKLLEAITVHAFPSLFTLAQDDFKLIVNSIDWAFKHDERNVSHTGLEILIQLVTQLHQNTQDLGGPEAAARVRLAFHDAFLLQPLLNDILCILTDTLHKPGLKYQSRFIMLVCHWAENGSLALSAGAGHPQGTCGVIRDFVVSFFSAFPNLTRAQIQAFALGLFDLSRDQDAFKQHLRDFLVLLKEFSAQDNADLFEDDGAAALQEAAKRQFDQERMAVPGMVPPQNLPNWG